MSAAKPAGGQHAGGAKALAVAAAVAIVAALPYMSQHGPPPLTPDWLPPSFIHRGIVSTVSYLDRWVSFLTPPNLAAFRSIMSMVHTAQLHAVVQLGIADVVLQTPISSHAIVQQITQCSEAGAETAKSCERVATRITRLLRATAAYGFFQEVPPGSEVWQHTAQSRFLASSTPGTLRAVVLNFGDVQYSMMRDLSNTVKSGESSFRRTHGDEFWAWYQKHPDQHAVFDATMEQLGKLGGADAAVAYDVPWSASSISHVVDIGGGYGHQAAWIVKANPGLNATILDLEPVVARAREAWRSSTTPPSPYYTVSHRVSFQGGDMFTPSSLPGPHQEARARAEETGSVVCASEIGTTYAYTLRDILHDWPDEACIAILTSLAQSMRRPGQEGACYASGGTAARDSREPSKSAARHPHSDRVYIIGRLIEPGTAFINSLGSFDADTVMLAAFGTTAGERTTGQYERLVQAAGLRLVAVHRTRGHYTVLEASL